jgi:hypothetical protein
MYLASVLALLLVLPIISILIELAAHTSADLVFLIAKWFVFWAGGVRLFIAGVRQTLNPAFTAVDIFGIKEPEAQKIVREVGFANLAMGLLNLASLVVPAWLVPAALVSGLYYAFAGLGHVRNTARTTNETIALVSDLAIAVVLLAAAVTLLVRTGAA